MQRSAGAKDFFDWLTPLREGHLDQSLREAFTIAGYIFYAACENIRKANILLLAGPKLDAGSSTIWASEI